MDFFILMVMVAIGFHSLKLRDQRRRIALLAVHLGNYQIEKLMETLTDGYLRALGEKELVRREQIWNLLGSSESQLVDQFERFASEFSKIDASQTRVSKIAMAVPYADKIFPGETFDLRAAFELHAKSIAAAVVNYDQRSPRDKAFVLSAELFLMQHTCHWFCRSRNVASARILVRHKTSYEQVLKSIAPETRLAYAKLTGV